MTEFNSFGDSRITEPLRRGQHDVTAFFCGLEDVDYHLQRDACRLNEAGHCRTYVMAEGDKIIGYYTIAPFKLIGNPPLSPPQNSTSLGYTYSPRHKRKEKKEDHIGYIISHVGVQRHLQRAGHGKRLMVDAIMTLEGVAEIVGGSFIMVPASSNDLVPFYAKFGFRLAQNTGVNMFRGISRPQVAIDKK